MCSVIFHPLNFFQDLVCKEFNEFPKDVKQTYLLSAIKQKSGFLVDCFLSTGMDVNFGNSFRENNANYVETINPLIYCCMDSNFKYVKKLVKAGADINRETPWGSTPVMFSTEVGDTETTIWLLQQGAKLETKTQTLGNYLKLNGKIFDKLFPNAHCTINQKISKEIRQKMLECVWGNSTNKSVAVCSTQCNNSDTDNKKEEEKSTLAKLLAEKTNKLKHVETKEKKDVVLTASEIKEINVVAPGLTEDKELNDNTLCHGPKGAIGVRCDIGAIGVRTATGPSGLTEDKESNNYVCHGLKGVIGAITATGPSELTKQQKVEYLQKLFPYLTESKINLILTLGEHNSLNKF